MKQINLFTVAIALIAMTSIFNACGDSDTFTDPRDGQKYKTVKIGEQVWMAENLKFKTSDFTCPNDDPENCLSWGNLYNISKLAEDPCPNGWHIPTTLEFESLLNYIKKNHPDIGIGVALKSKSGWNHNIDNAEEKYGKRKGNGDDIVGFNATPMPNEGEAVFITWPSFYELDTLIGTRLRKLDQSYKQYKNSIILDRNVNYTLGHKAGAIRCIENSDYLATKLVSSFLGEFINEYRFDSQKINDSGFIKADHQFDIRKYLAYPESTLQFTAEFRSYYGDSIWEKRIPQNIDQLDSVTFLIKNLQSLNGCQQNNEWKITEKADNKNVIIQYSEPNDEHCKYIIPEEVRIFLKSVKSAKNISENEKVLESLFENATKHMLPISELRNKY